MLFFYSIPPFPSVKCIICFQFNFLYLCFHFLHFLLIVSIPSHIEAIKFVTNLALFILFFIDSFLVILLHLSKRSLAWKNLTRCYVKDVYEGNLSCVTDYVTTLPLISRLISMPAISTYSSWASHSDDENREKVININTSNPIISTYWLR